MMEAEQYDNIDQQNDDLQDQLVIQADRNQSLLSHRFHLNDRIKTYPVPVFKTVLNPRCCVRVQRQTGKINIE